MRTRRACLTMVSAWLAFGILATAVPIREVRVSSLGPDPVPEVVIKRENTTGTSVLTHQCFNLSQVNVFDLSFIVQIIRFGIETDDFYTFLIEPKRPHHGSRISDHHVNSLSLRRSLGRICRRLVVIKTGARVLPDDIS